MCALQLLICCNRADQRQDEFERLGGDELRRKALTKLCAEGDGHGMELSHYFDPTSPDDLNLVQNTCFRPDDRLVRTLTIPQACSGCCVCVCCVCCVRMLCVCCVRAGCVAVCRAHTRVCPVCECACVRHRQTTNLCLVWFVITAAALRSQPGAKDQIVSFMKRHGVWRPQQVREYVARVVARQQEHTGITEGALLAALRDRSRTPSQDSVVML